VTPRDRLRNPTDYTSGLGFNTSVYPPEGDATADGASPVTVTFSHTRAATYQVGVLIGRDHISGSPFAVVIKPADAKPLDSALGGAGLTLATAGEVTSFRIMTRDLFGNAVEGDP